MEPFHESPTPHVLDAAVRANDAYRRVLFTDRRVCGAETQQVAMAIGYGRDAANQSIGWEQHTATAQYFAVVEGSGTLYSSSTSPNALKAERIPVTVGDKWLIPPGTWHDVVGHLRLLTIYYPPHHADGTVHERRVDAEQQQQQ